MKTPYFPLFLLFFISCSKEKEVDYVAQNEEEITLCVKK
jgi:hypothetical protein